MGRKMLGYIPHRALRWELRIPVAEEAVSSWPKLVTGALLVEPARELVKLIRQDPIDKV